MTAVKNYSDLAYQINEKLREKGASHTCPFCTKDLWEILPHAVAVSSKADWKNDNEKSTVREALALVCQNCGFVRLQLRDILNI